MEAFKILTQDFNYQPQTPSGVPAPPSFHLTGPLVGINNLGDLINRIFLILIPIAAIILFIAFVWGGFDLMFSQGDPGKIKKGRAKVTSAIIGFVIIIFSIFIVRVIALIFNLKSSLPF
jgi:hypothetical protein